MIWLKLSPTVLQPAPTHALELAEVHVRVVVPINVVQIAVEDAQIIVELSFKINQMIGREYLRCPRCGRGPEDTPMGNYIRLLTHPDCCSIVFCEECRYENMVTTEKGLCQFCGKTTSTLSVYGYVKILYSGKKDFFYRI